MPNIKYNGTKNKKYKIACIKCDGETYHKVLHSVNVNKSNDDIHYWNDYEIVCCQGCKEFSFRTNSLCSEDIDFDLKTGEPCMVDNVELYPNRIAGRKQVKDMYLLPTEILKIYKETHGAVCARLNILAAIGIRALVESICIAKKAKGRTLENKIDYLVENDILTSQTAETLHQTRLLGNDSAHKTISADDHEIDIAMDIVETLIKTVYIIPKKAIRLNRR